MPRNAAVNVENNFSKGLVTEASAIAFPENAATEIYDCIITNKNAVTRRLGYGYENNHSTRTIDRDDVIVTEYLWKNVSGDGDLTISVLQVGEALYFYNATTTPISGNEITSTIDLTTYSPASAPSPGLVACGFSEGNGVLFVTHPDLEPFYLEYNSAAETISATEISIEIRDLVGVDDTLTVSERPTSTVAGLSDTHKYNLFNQGWYFNNNAALTAWDTARTDMPSNADIWWVFKNSSNAFAASEIANFDTGSTPAPKGHYLLNPFNEDRSTVSGIGAFTPVTSGGKRPSVSAFFSGRVFYAGVPYPGFNNKLYYSQIIESSDQYGRCYQRNDPTSEISFDVLRSDGGVIDIQDAGTVVMLWSLQTSLLVFATNGVWSITGSEGTGFAATDYSVSKISSINSISRSSFVDVDGFPCWWNNAGIYLASLSDLNNVQIQNLTDASIKTYYDAIPPSSKLQAKGDYNPVTKVARWLFRNDAATTTNTSTEYQEILNLDFLKGAFYPWTIPTSSTLKIHDIFVVVSEGGAIETNQVIDSALDTVVDSSINNVVVTTLSDDIVKPQFKYLVSYPDGSNSYNFTFMENNDTSYLDYVDFSITGVDYSSYFLAGYKVHGQTQNFFQPNYVFVFLEQETDASCLMQGVFDWTTSTISNKWSSQQQVYNPSSVNRSINFRRLKVRGKGRALQLRFESESGKPFTIIGWSLKETGNADV